MAIGAYIIELGRAYGLNLEFVTTTIGVSSWIATLGAGLVVVFGTRWGACFRLRSARLQR